MIRLRVGDQDVAISSELLSKLVMANMPGMLVGTEQPKGFQEAAMKSGIKALVPLLMGWFQMKIEKERLPIAPPDLKSPAAKQNVVMYAIDYMLTHATELAEHQVFTLEGDRDDDGTLVLSRIASTYTGDDAGDQGTDAHPVAVASAA